MVSTWVGYIRARLTANVVKLVEVKRNSAYWYRINAPEHFRICEAANSEELVHRGRRNREEHEVMAGVFVRVTQRVTHSNRVDVVRIESTHEPFKIVSKDFTIVVVAMMVLGNRFFDHILEKVMPALWNVVVKADHLQEEVDDARVSPIA